VIFGGRDAWIWWDWVTRNTDRILDALRQHLWFTVLTVGIAFVLSLPAGVLIQRRRTLRAPVLGLAGLLYTIPSLAFFALLSRWPGIFNLWTALIPLIVYNLYILIRAVVVGLDAVDRSVLDAANGMGYRPWRRLTSVELPLAMPSILAGLRLATVTTVGLVTVTAVLGADRGGLGRLMYDGFFNFFRTPVTVATILTVALAVFLDVVIIGTGRLLAPWSKARRRRA
jgi:osmoprotectant transport system permease protein